MFSVGIDIASEKHEVALYSQECGIIERFSIKNSQEGFQKLITKTNSLSPKRFSLESSGPYGKALERFLIRNNYDVRVFPPLKVYRFKNLQKEYLKTDSFDAEVIAKLGASEFAENEPKAEMSRYGQHKMILHHLFRMKRELASLKNKIHALTAQQDGDSFLLGLLTDQMKFLKNKIAQTEKLVYPQIMGEAESQKEIGFLTSIPGIGLKTAITFLVEIENIKKFPSVERLVGFVGWYPKISQSGKYLNPSPKMVKKGSRYLRKMLFMASLAAVRHNLAMRNLFNKKISQGKKKKQALINVGGKLLRIMWGVLKNQTLYSENRIFIQPLTT